MGMEVYEPAMAEGRVLTDYFAIDEKSKVREISLLGPLYSSELELLELKVNDTLDKLDPTSETLVINGIGLDQCLFKPRRFISALMTINSELSKMGGSMTVRLSHEHLAFFENLKETTGLNVEFDDYSETTSSQATIIDKSYEEVEYQRIYDSKTIEVFETGLLHVDKVSAMLNELEEFRFSRRVATNAKSMLMNLTDQGNDGSFYDDLDGIHLSLELTLSDEYTDLNDRVYDSLCS